MPLVMVAPIVLVAHHMQSLDLGITELLTYREEAALTARFFRIKCILQ
jgi:hypothetical protein